jgi:peptidoglycan/xylan/chitin deacetylase (PgdA/CDA1 family)
VVPRAFLVRRGSGRRRRLALTFDDGPHELTRAYLDVLDAHGASASFFLVGRECTARPDDVLEIVRRGHEVWGHGFTHTTFDRLPIARLLDELRATSDLVPPMPRRRPLLRPPRGVVTLRSLAACAAAGYTTALWSLDSGDWRETRPDAIAVAVAPARVAPGEVVLLHEGQRCTLAALPRILEGLRAAGYELVTVGDLLGS